MGNPVHRPSIKYARGQGLIETAIVATLLLIVILTLVEFGFLLNTYLTMQDATRNAARYSSDNLYSLRDSVLDCKTTRDFYRQTGCVLNQELVRERPQITLSINTGDDIVVSVFSVAGADVSNPPTVKTRFPLEEGENGWSEAKDWLGVRNQVSSFSSSSIQSQLDGAAPSTGFLLVETFFNYYQRLNLPWVQLILPNPFLLHTYALMPLVSAEPKGP